MRWEVRLEKKAEKDLQKIPRKYQLKILTVIPLLAENPYIGKKLSGKLEGLFSYKVWPYRIIYRVYKKLVLVVIIRIGYRQVVYK